MMTVREVAGWVGGRFTGDGDTVLKRATSMADARPGDLTMVHGRRNLKYWASCPAAAAIVDATFPDDARPLIHVAEPLPAFLGLLQRLRGDRTRPRGIHPTAIIHPTARLGSDVSIDAFCILDEGTVLGDHVTLLAGAKIGRWCRLGDEVTIHANVVVHDDSTLGHRVIVHTNTVIGADGFGYRQVTGKHVRVPQLGSVILEDDVEVGANSTIDRGTIGPTRIGTGTKIDNLVMISHNCQIGKHNIIVAQVGLAGSCVTGDYVILAGQVGVADHITIGDRAIIAAQSGVMGDIDAGAHYMGYPARPAREYLKNVSGWSDVPLLRKQMKRLLKHLKLEEDDA